MKWTTVKAPPDAAVPQPMTVRVQSIPPRHYFPEHFHNWNQMVYAISGVLTVAAEGQSYVISPEQAVWLPTGHRHRVGTLLGAEFRSLWIANDAAKALPSVSTVFGVTPLLKALIIEAAQIEGDNDEDGYRERVTELIFDQLRRAPALPGALPWPLDGSRLVSLCEALYANPADTRGPDAWGRELGMSERTLARRFEAEMDMSLRSWRRRLRLFKAIELLGGGLDVTRTAMEVGYSSTSAFVFAFRGEMGCSPQAYMRRRGNSQKVQ
ncbi:MAG: helix-turn-helix transcriptional regulator [Hyphomicrobiaceae bacterium]|nr:helix-turn-helix transcriptional regulator [Hyphomicrobiaceae bacterium]MCC0010872.1 helix-turn-helix transcriptional regulator [Hyphomicrobiaceae bacterium]